MNTPTQNKNLAVWNIQALDSYHDIIVSFDYARYNTQIEPTGGFCLIFYNSIVDMPHEGGPGNSLGYTPSNDGEYCRLNGFKGFEGAFLGVGFSNSGEFALPTELIDGNNVYSPNSVAVRGGVASNYGLLYNSPNLNLISDLETFTVDQFLSSAEDRIFRSIRVILSKNCSQLTVQAKSNNADDNFVTIKELNLPEITRTSLRVALANTSDDGLTEFKIRNFNVAGYPGIPNAKLLENCFQNIQINSVQPFENKKLPANKEYAVVPYENNITTYTTDGFQYRLKNTNYGDLKILGEDGDFVICNTTSTKEILIYKYLGQKLALTSSIVIPGVDIPTSADIYEKTLAVCTSGDGGYIYIYEYSTDFSLINSVGTWQLRQTIPSINVDKGRDLGIETAINKDTLMVGNYNNRVHVFKRNNFNGIWENTQTLECPTTGYSHFGYTIDIDDNDAVIGAPINLKPKFGYTGEGEVFHYYYNSLNKSWQLVMGISNFYGINTPAGNFGESIRLKGNNCIVGSSGEMWSEGTAPEDQPNVGKAYLFTKTPGGIFSRGTILYPASSIRTNYMFFGKAVNLYDNYAFVTSPFYKSAIYRLDRSYLSIFDTDCFYLPPADHLPVPSSAVDVNDKSGYLISFINNTYLVQISGSAPLLNDPGIQDQTTYITPISTTSFKLEVVPYGSDPLYITWKKETGRVFNSPTINLTSFEVDYTSLSDGGIYYAIVNNVYGAVTSAPIIVNVYSQPYFIQQPQNTTVASGQTATLTAIAVGVPDPAYRWQIYDVALADFINLSITLSTAVVSFPNVVTELFPTSSFRCRATNVADTAFSDTAVLTVV